MPAPPWWALQPDQKGVPGSMRCPERHMQVAPTKMSPFLRLWKSFFLQWIMWRWRVLGRWRVQDLQEYQVFFFFKSARFRFRSWQDSIIFKSWLDSIIFRSWRPTQLYFSCSHPKFCHQDGKCFETVQLWVKHKNPRPAPRVIFNLIQEEEDK